MNVSIFGLGYVGAVTTACLSRDGINVIGVDINENKVKAIARGESPIVEAGLTELLEAGVEKGRITATTDAEEAVRNSEISIISVGTPSRSDGALDLQYVYRVCEIIGKAAAEKEKDHIVIIRSTVLPGTTEECADILNKHSGNVNIDIGFNPEFLREGSAVKDFDEPAFTIIGTKSNLVELTLKDMYASVDAPFVVVEPGVAEMIKYAANAWHATKIAFANEIGRVAKHAGVDGRKVMEILVEDRKLNISTAYMRPGFAYGGSCLPKDVRALEYYGKINNVGVPLLDSLSKSNKAQIQLAFDLIRQNNYKKIAMLGLAFKPGTDDLRESPSVELAEQLIGKGYELKIYDPAINESRLIGSNKEFIDSKIPHLSKLLVDENKIIEDVDVLIVTHGAGEFRKVLEKANQSLPVFDLTGIVKNLKSVENYEGIAW
jgi:GDP-mannose 6-dehydrogenase